MEIKPKILMVCLGNICRSPMAEGVFRHACESNVFPVEIDSCGTGGWHSGEAPDKRAQRCMQEKGLDISHLRARQIHKSDLDIFHHILVMDKQNYLDVLSLCENQEQKNKVKLVLDYHPEAEKSEVPDPYYGEMADFEEVYHMLETAAKVFIEKHKA